MLTINDNAKRPGGYILNAECVVPASLDEVFEFYSNAMNLEKLTPPWMNFKVVSKPPIDMHEGRLIDYKLTVMGLPLRWQSKITVWEPKHRFMDIQTRGPYKYWEHEHTFEEVSEGVRVRDEVQYGVPGGVIVHRLKVRPDIEKIFAYREQKQKEMFGG